MKDLEKIFFTHTPYKLLMFSKIPKPAAKL